MSTECLLEASASASGGMPKTETFGRPYYRQDLAGLAPARQFALIGNLTDAYCLLEMVLVEAGLDALDNHLVSSGTFPVHGDGPTLQSALADFRVCLAEYYELVEEGAQDGDPFDAQELRRLRRYITRR